VIKPLQGVIHGNTIKLAGDPGLPEGELVEFMSRYFGNLGERQDSLQGPRLPGPPAQWFPGSQETAGGMLSATWSDMTIAISRALADRRDSKNPRG